MSLKWCTVQAVSINLDGDHPTHVPRAHENVTKLGGKITASRLAAGMQSGRTAVILQLDLDDGSSIVLETSLAIWRTVGEAFKARDEFEGRPMS